MATYGRGQMLGSGINPESFKQDYSGFARAAETQAQGMANLGASIGGAIKDFGEEKKRINQDIAKGKSALQFAKANYPELAGRIDEIGKIFSDVNVSKADQAAAGSQMGDFVTAMIRGQEFNTEVDLRKRALDIQEAEALARNEPPMPAPLTYKRATNVAYGGGFLDDLFIGSDGEYYDEARNLVADIGAYARGESPEVYSGYSTFSDDLGGFNTPLPSLPEDTQNIAPFIPPIYTERVPTPFINAGQITTPFINAEQINSALGTGSVLPSKPGTPDDDLAASILAAEAELGIDENQRREIKSRLRFDTDKKDARFLTDEEKKQFGLDTNKAFAAEFQGNNMVSIPELVQQGEPISKFRPATPEESEPFGGMKGQINEKDGRFYPVQESAPELKVKNLMQAAEFYSKGDKQKALIYATAAGIGGLFGNLTISDLDQYFGGSDLLPNNNDNRAPLDGIFSTER